MPYSIDTVMDHLNEMAGAIRSAVQETLFGCTAVFLATRRARNGVYAGSEAGKDRIQVIYDLLLTADHQAIAMLTA